MSSKHVSARLRIASTSTWRHCLMYRATDGNWYMELGDYEYADYQHSTTHGPFPTEDATIAYLDSFTNPGGWETDNRGTRAPPPRPTNGLIAGEVAKVSRAADLIPEQEDGIDGVRYAELALAIE